MMLTPQHWRERAENARKAARLMRDPEASQLLREIAAAYDKIADRVQLVTDDPQIE
jgi:hypothetical protein